jgi:hypothetical protein
MNVHHFLLALGIMRHVGVTHNRQFTDAVFAGVSMRARAVGHDLSILVRQVVKVRKATTAVRKTRPAIKWWGRLR